MTLINNTSQAINLDDGTILASAGSNGSIKEVESISDRDRRRYVDPGKVRIAPEPEPEPAKKVDTETKKGDTETGRRGDAATNAETATETATETGTLKTSETLKALQTPRRKGDIKDV